MEKNKYQQLRQKSEALLKQKSNENPEQYYDNIEQFIEELSGLQIEPESHKEKKPEENRRLENERKQFLSILYSIPQNIYVADLTTYEILFTNKHLKENIGRDITGEACYKAIQGKNDVCSFCTNKYIKNTEKPYLWEHYNPVMDKHFYIMDRKIKWSDNREVRFELAIDITDRKIAEQALKESEDRFKKFSNFTSEGLVIHNEGIAIDINKAGVKMLGYERKEIIGTYLFRFIHPDYRAAVKENMLKKSTKPLEIIVLRKDGSRFHAEIKAENILYNNAYHRVVSVRDISERIEAEEALRKSEKKYRIIAENVSDVITILNLTQRKFTYISPSVYHLRGYTAEEAMQQSIDETFTPESARIVRENSNKRIQQLLANPKEISKNVYVNELQQPCKDGSVIWTETTTRYHINKQNEIEVISVSRNIEERKKQEQVIKNQNIKLTEAIATKDKFFNIIAHDLKSPFNSILGFSDLLIRNIDKYDKDKIKRFVTTINQSGKSTFKLLENLLQWARSQQDKIPFNPTINNLYDIAYEIFMLSAGNAKDKKITIDLNISKDINIVADTEMLKTIIRNLVSNAIKYTSENGKITISGKQANEETVVIEITDTGTGMDEQTKNSLFKIGATISKEGTKGEHGTGFGLLLCKEFAEKHKGKIYVESELGKGSTFSFILPKSNI